MDVIKEIAHWHTPATDYPTGRVGNAQLKPCVYQRGYYHLYDQPDDEGQVYRYFQATKRLTVQTLRIKGQTWMVDDPPHYYAMRAHAQAMSGHVLCAGLGLGLIIHRLQENPDVSHITVVERDADVIALIKPLLGKLRVHPRIIKADWDAAGWLKRLKRPIDGVLYDLFVGEGRELLPSALREMFRLHERFPDAKVRRVHGFDSAALARAIGK